MIPELEPDGLEAYLRGPKSFILLSHNFMMLK